MLRILDLLFSTLGLILLVPIFLVIAIWIKLDSHGPIFYIQGRVGKNGVDFKLVKFRSMKIFSDKLGLLTVGGNDNRITRPGLFIRRFKLDELPQLYNVLIGDMSLVGPRPEVRKYVNFYSEEQKMILSVRPGITDEASIAYKNENEILGNSDDPEKLYINEIMPHKIALNQKFINSPSVFNYFSIIIRTIF